MFAMLDVETLGTSPRAVVLSLGCVLFDATGLRSGGINVHLKLDEQLRLGRVVSEGTLTWWMHQSDAARLAAFDVPAEERVAIAPALETLAAYLPNDLEGVWANGADFDLALVRSLADDAGVPLPWPYKLSRDYRTLRALYPLPLAYEKPEVSHHALSDAIAQAKHAAKILQLLNLGGARADG